MASLDTRRPAAQEQLASSASRSASTRCRSSRASRPVPSPSARCKRRKLGGHDVVMLDTAGRTIDEAADGRDGRDQATRQAAETCWWPMR
jgi:signal recognition particle subunit SRP54